MGAFGDKFRKAREAKNFSLDDVSNVTKIGSRMLQAIEDEHFDRLPGGVFNKGFIRAYAKHLGLDAEQAVTEYLACLRQAQIDAHEVWEPAAAPHPAPQTKPAAYQKPSLKAHAPVEVPTQAEEELPDLQLPRAEHVRPPRRDYLERRSEIPWNLVALAVVIIAFASYLWIRHSRTIHTEASAAPAKPPAAQTAPPSATASAPKPATPAPSTPASPSPTSPTAKPATPPAISPPANQLSKKDEKAPKPVSAEPVPPENDQATGVTVQNFAPAKAAKPAASMTLVIRASETSWISITADGEPVTHETLIAPAATTFRASRELVARIGNAGGVSFLFNGQEIPAQGNSGEVKTFLFDAQGMREIPNQPAGQNR